MAKNINYSNLKAAREKKGLTYENMAQKCNVTHVTYRKWEKGETIPPLDKAKIIADIFNTKIDTLFYSRSFRII